MNFTLSTEIHIPKSTTTHTYPDLQQPVAFRHILGDGARLRLLTPLELNGDNIAPKTLLQTHHDLQQPVAFRHILGDGARLCLLTLLELNADT